MAVSCQCKAEIATGNTNISQKLLSPQKNIDNFDHDLYAGDDFLKEIAALLHLRLDFQHKKRDNA